MPVSPTPPGSLRLVDYVVVAGYDHERGRRRRKGGGGGGGGGSMGGFHCQGTIRQRFPARDWEDTPFIDGLEHFCQPNGWVLSAEQSAPRAFLCVLTDINGQRHFCAILSFSEAVPKEADPDPADTSEVTGSTDALNVRASAVDEELEDDGDEALHASLRHQPRSLVGGGHGHVVHRSLPRHVVPGVSLPATAHDLFAPKCLVLVSRHDYPDLLKNCLGVIYTAYSECLVGVGGERIRLETLVGNLLGHVFVPPAGGPQLRFSLGAGDKMCLQPAVFPRVPVTNCKVALLFQQLGIRNVLTLFCAAMTELKILFYSQSFNRLTEACMALTALMYPMRYSHVFIPVLPSSLLEVLATPTPFIIGVNAVHEAEIVDLLDVVRVDLDGGAITVPENMTIHLVPDAFLKKAQHELSLVLHPELAVADHAFQSSSSSSSSSSASAPRRPKPLVVQDKELRAVMLRLMAQLLQGYRSCLTVVRIHPQPYIAFHKAAFLGLRNLCDSEFVRRFLDCMFFNTFIHERGPSWRQCDVFDDLYSVYGEQSLLEQNDPAKVTSHVNALVEELFRNENPITTLNQPYAQKIPQPAEGAMSRVHQPVFPSLDEKMVTEIIQRGVDRHQLEQATTPNVPDPCPSMKLVPMGQQVSLNGHSPHTLLPNSARRLGVLRNCITSIFENKIADAKKTFPAVISALKTKQARMAFCEELASHHKEVGSSSQLLLEHQQFDMIVRLMNAALQDDSDMDEHGVALALLPLASTFGRKLAKGVTQFAFTLIQDHAVWQNQQFWEAAFFNDVQKGIKALYLAMQDQNSNDTSLADQQQQRQSSSSGGSGGSGSELSAERHVGSRAREVRKSAAYQGEKSVLELAARELRCWDELTPQAKDERVKAEEQTVYSQALAYINRMIYLLLPLDAAASSASAKSRKRLGGADDLENAASNSISNSMAESDSIDAESGFEEPEIPDSGQQVIKSVLRFADKVCAESSVSDDHMRNISSMIPTSVAMHLEELEGVAKEAKRLPPIHKSKINFPSLLPGEDLVIREGLRVYLLADGRSDDGGGGGGSGGNSNPPGLALLPAEGALFLTSYRLIFKGSPIDAFASEHVITRFFPVSSLTREKRFTLNEYMTQIQQQLREGIQLRSNTFQLIRAAFDDEVSMDDVDNLRRQIQRVQYPENIFHFFAFRGFHNLAQEPGAKSKEKNAKYLTIRGFASKTLKNVTRVTGYQSKKRKTSKYLLPNVMPTQGRLSIAEMTNHSHQHQHHHDGNRVREEDDASEEGSGLNHPVAMPSAGGGGGGGTSKTLERLSERSYFKDWKRLGLISSDYSLARTSHHHHHSESFRVSMVNHRYSLALSYPALLLVPGRISDDSLRRFSRCHKHSRFPVITWKHPGNQALLLRGAGFHKSGVMGMIRRHQDGHGQHGSGVGGGGGGGQSSQAADLTNVEAELFITAIIQATPKAMVRPQSTYNISGSDLSINSLLTTGGGGGANSGDYPPTHNYPTLTPNMSRKFSPLSKAMDTLTRGTSGPPKFGRLSLSAVKGNRNLGSQTSLASSSGFMSGYRGSSQRYSDSEQSTSADTGINSFLQRTSLYIFADKSQIKGAKIESHPKTEFIPVEYPEPKRIRTSFKKLMRACVPSTASPQPDQTFLKQVEASEWLGLLQMLLQLSGAVVDLIDIQGASVMVCLEDGWDVTAQVSSLALLCLDPYYRTLDGFRVLIEKEWLALGHRFNYRGNLSNPNVDYGFTPLFLQFLDAVHQIHAQFPMAFEFNQFYIRFLAYHHVSCRFRTFLLDNEHQKNEVGLLAHEDVSSRSNGSIPRQYRNMESHSSDDEIYPGGPPGGIGSAAGSGVEGGGNSSATIGGSNVGINIFDYIDFHAARSSVFHNFMYCKELSHAVLRPFSHISDLRIWEYLLNEELKHGAAYDLELYHLDLQQEEYDSNEASASSALSAASCAGDESNEREPLTANYDCLMRTAVDSCTKLLNEISQLESELGHLPNRWKHHWEQAQAAAALTPTPASPPMVQTTPSITSRYHGRMMHKRSTMELILKGKIGAAAASSSSPAAANLSGDMSRLSTGGGGAGGSNGGGGSGGNSYAYSHHFEKYNYSTPTSCDVCSSLLWGPVKTGLRCADCGYNLHEKCRDNVLKACTKYKSVQRDTTTDNLDHLTRSTHDEVSASSASAAAAAAAVGTGRVTAALGELNDDDDDLYQHFSPAASSSDENSQIICQGYLFKQANFRIKGWKQRWFVLDATKHQLRYYDTREDFHCKGHIDLSEVTKISEGSHTPGAPKKPDGCFFDLQTVKRTYTFCAESSPAAAHEWIKKIQSCLST